MKNIMNSLVPVLSAALLWCGTSAANTGVNISASAFHPMNPYDGYSCIYYNGNAHELSNNCGLLINVVASLPFVPTGTSDMTLWVDGNNPGGDWVGCTVSSYNYDYTYLGSGSNSTNATGNFDMPITLPAAGLGSWAYLTIQCYLPSGGKLLGVAQSY